MKHHKPRLATLIPIILLLVAVSLSGQSRGDVLLQKGTQAFGGAQYDEALRLFRDLILDSGLESYHPAAYFWIVKSHMALGQYEDAEKNLELFLNEFPESEHYVEGSYQWGRLLFLQSEYEQAIQALQRFIGEHTDSPYVANSYFWIAESLYALGQFTDAYKIFSIVTDTFPSSFKVEAATYRKSLIELKEREQELLKLLKWSHEEYLRAVENFQRKERSYEQAIVSYQRRIANLSSQSLESEVQDLTVKVKGLEEDLDSYKRQVEVLTSQLALSGGSSGNGVGNRNVGNSTAALLALKQEILDLRSFYLQKLGEETGR